MALDQKRREREEGGEGMGEERKERGIGERRK